jgi:MFS family permease
MRRLLLLASTIVFVDVAFYSAITPLLPTYVDDLGLSKAEAGVLTASYAAGTLIASLPAGLVAARIGARPAVLGGLALLGVSSLGFGLAESAVLLDTARFAQGVGGALTWSGALTWLIVSAPEDRRGELIGSALGAAVAGALLGPALGGLAGEVGTEPVFGSVLVLAAVLAALALRLPPPPVEVDREPLGAVLRIAVRGPVARAAGLVALPSLLFGAVAVIIPLRIDELGGGAGVVAAGFATGAAIEASLAPVVGRASDRRGRRTPLVFGLAVCGGGLALVPAVDAVGAVVAALIVICFGAALCFAPAMATLSDAAESTGLHQGYAAGLVNMAWASGQVAGSIGGGAAAGAFGDAVPCLVLGAALLVVALALPGEEAAPGPVSAAKAD